MVNWVVDKGLLVLRAQIDEMAPNRSKASDGFKGDKAHELRESDHNPEHPAPAGNPDYQVDAGDFTHDPAHGCDIGEIFEEIRLSRDPRVRYAIFNGRMFSSYPVSGYPAYTWRPYSGSDMHREHGHLSVVDSPHDVTTPWRIGMATNDETALYNRTRALIRMEPENPKGDNLKPEVNEHAKAIRALQASANQLAAALLDIKTALDTVKEGMLAVMAKLEAQGPAQTYTGEATVSLVVRGTDGGS